MTKFIQRKGMKSPLGYTYIKIYESFVETYRRNKTYRPHTYFFCVADGETIVLAANELYDVLPYYKIVD